MKKTAFLFPGQGSQSVGMGQDLYEEYVFVRELFDMAEEVTKINLSRLCFKGPMDQLTLTINLQPAITVVNLACLAALEKEGIHPHWAAGHSLGEYAALYAARVISDQDTMRLVHERGRLMHRESEKHQGAMHAILGLSMDQVQKLVEKEQPNGPVSVANHNMETQIVVTGAPEPVKRVSAMAKELGAKAIPLKVSGAWHSDLMKDAVPDFEQVLKDTPFQAPQCQVIHNLTADTADNPEDIRNIMAGQICAPVRWFDTMQRLMAEEVEQFVEVGPGKVLAGLLRKTLPKTYPYKLYNVDGMKGLEKFFKDNL